MELDTYLFFNGDCEAAFKLYEKVLGGKIDAMMTHEGTPAASQVPPEWLKKILHARMTIGTRVLMASDAPPGRYAPQQGFSISIGLKDEAQAERIFNELQQVEACRCRCRRRSGRRASACWSTASAFRG